MLVLSVFIFNSCFVVWKKKMMFMDLFFEEKKKCYKKCLILYIVEIIFLKFY